MTLVSCFYSGYIFVCFVSKKLEWNGMNGSVGGPTHVYTAYDVMTHHNVVHLRCFCQTSDRTRQDDDMNGWIPVTDGELDDAKRLDAAQSPHRAQVAGLIEPGVVLRPDQAPVTQSTAADDAEASVQILCVDGDHWVAVCCIAGVLTVSVP